MEVGAQLGWTVGDQGARFALAAKYCPAKDLELKAKVDNQSKVAFAATHHLTNQVLLCSIFVVVIRVENFLCEASRKRGASRLTIPCYLHYLLLFHSLAVSTSVSCTYCLNFSQLFSIWLNLASAQKRNLSAGNHRLE